MTQSPANGPDLDPHALSPRGLLRVEGLHTHFHSPAGAVRAVDGVSLGLDRGMTLGIVGESGSGKSALARSIMNLLPRRNMTRTGKVLLDGRDLLPLSARQMRKVWSTQMAIVLQDPLTALNPVMRVGRQVAEPLQVHRGMSSTAARARAVELLESMRIPDPVRCSSLYPYELSGGMRQRVVMAIALSCDPQILFADEPTTALDVTIQAQILRLLDRHRRQRKMGMVFISHDLAVIGSIADTIAVMYAGQIVEHAPAVELLRQPRMPYTEALLQATPRDEQAPHTPLATIPGRPPNPARPRTGCRFAPRCAYAQDLCVAEAPPLIGATGSHSYRCWFPVGTPDGDSARMSNQRRGQTVTGLAVVETPAGIVGKT